MEHHRNTDDACRSDYSSTEIRLKTTWAVTKEVLTPMAAPHLLQDGADWQDLPCIAVSGPRPGWQEWAVQSGQAAPPVPLLRFDSFVSAYAAAISGAGVLLGSVPLCAAALADKSLTLLSSATLEHGAGYWMTSKEGKLPRKQWDDLVACLCANS